MDTNKRMQLIDAQTMAAAALDAGQRLAARVAAKRSGFAGPEKPTGAALGAVLASPAVFWGGAVACVVDGDGETVEPVALAMKYAAARLAVGDLNFARETLLGQATWAGALAVKLAEQAGQAKHGGHIQLYKLAMQAQRQAAQAIATAAALNKLVDADSVAVG